MPRPFDPLRRSLSWAELWPSARNGLAVVALFAAGLWLARHYAAPIRELLSAHAGAGIAVFFASSVLAVLMPLATNLPLMPIAVLAWGPWFTALVLLAGWVVGAALSFTLGRRARGPILRRFPSMQRHARIDRLIHPQHRMLSLIMLRMTFPVDVLSYALGSFSRDTRAWENAASTAIGAAPFAVLFALFPTLTDTAQWAVFGGSALAFVLYAAWVLRRPSRAADAGS